jgi:3-isopropylmalate dehydratase small subunit
MTEHPPLTIDLQRQVILGEGIAMPFQVGPLRRRMLMKKLDPIGLNMASGVATDAVQVRDVAGQPWLRLSALG